MTKGQKKKESAKGESFEDAMKKLEVIVARLEGGDLPLEESLQIFEEGVRLTRVCSSRLDDAEKRIEILMRKNANEVEARKEDPELFLENADHGAGEGETG